MNALVWLAVSTLILVILALNYIISLLKIEKICESLENKTLKLPKCCKEDCYVVSIYSNRVEIRWWETFREQGIVKRIKKTLTQKIVINLIWGTYRFPRGDYPGRKHKLEYLSNYLLAKINVLKGDDQKEKKVFLERRF